jgi:hypothetical protein
LNPTSAKELNNKRRAELAGEIKTAVIKLTALAAEVEAAKDMLISLSATSLEGQADLLVQSLKGERLSAWAELLRGVPEERPQLIYFEYNDIHHGGEIEADSYGIIGLKRLADEELPLFEDPGFNYDFFHDWEAHYGIELPYLGLLARDFSYDKYEDALHEDSEPLGKAYDIALELTLSLSLLAANLGFSKLMRMGELEQLALPVGTPFSFGEHDMDQLLDVFYVLE